MRGSATGPSSRLLTREVLLCARTNCLGPAADLCPLPPCLVLYRRLAGSSIRLDPGEGVRKTVYACVRVSVCVREERLCDNGNSRKDPHLPALE